MVKQSILVFLSIFVTLSLFIFSSEIVRADDNNDIINIVLKTGHFDTGQWGGVPDPSPRPVRFTRCTIYESCGVEQITVVSGSDGVCRFKFPKGACGNLAFYWYDE